MTVDPPGSAEDAFVTKVLPRLRDRVAIDADLVWSPPATARGYDVGFQIVEEAERIGGNFVVRSTC